jgi:hypothetical protein
MPGSDGSWDDLPLEITQADRPHSGSAPRRAGDRRRLRARIAGTPTRPWWLAAMPFSGSVRRTRSLLRSVVLAGISLTHPSQGSQRISQINHSRANSHHFRRTTPTPGSPRPPYHLRPAQVASAGTRRTTYPLHRATPYAPTSGRATYPVGPRDAVRADSGCATPYTRLRRRLRPPSGASNRHLLRYPIRKHPHPAATLLPRPPGHPPP